MSRYFCVWRFLSARPLANSLPSAVMSYKSLITDHQVLLFSPRCRAMRRRRTRPRCWIRSQCGRWRRCRRRSSTLHILDRGV